MSCAKVSWFWDFLSYFRRQNKYKIRDSWPRDINLKTLVGTLLPRLAVAVCWVLCYVPIFSIFMVKTNSTLHTQHSVSLLPKFDSFFIQLAFRLGFFIEIESSIIQEKCQKADNSVHIIWTNDRRWPPCN